MYPSLNDLLLFSAQEMGYQPTQDMLEQENNSQEDMLSSKVKVLKSVSISLALLPVLYMYAF